MLDHVLVGEAETVQDDDLVVEPGKVGVGVGIVPPEIGLVDRFPAFEPARREPEDLVLPSAADALPLLKAGQHVVAVFSLHPDDLDTGRLQNRVHPLEWLVGADVTLFAIDDDDWMVGTILSRLIQSLEQVFFQSVWQSVQARRCEKEPARIQKTTLCQVGHLWMQHPAGDDAAVLECGFVHSGHRLILSGGTWPPSHSAIRWGQRCRRGALLLLAPPPPNGESSPPARSAWCTSPSYLACNPRLTSHGPEMLQWVPGFLAPLPQQFVDRLDERIRIDGLVQEHVHRQIGFVRRKAVGYLFFIVQTGENHDW